MITTSPNGSPCLRNVFLLERADPGDGLQLRRFGAEMAGWLPCLDQGFEDDVLHYGQNLRMKLCPFSESKAKCFVNNFTSACPKSIQQFGNSTNWRFTCYDRTQLVATDAY